MSKDGKGQTTLIDRLFAPRDLLMDEEFLYWHDANGNIVRVAKDGGVPAVLVSSERAHHDPFYGLAQDGGDLYFGYWYWKSPTDHHYEIQRMSKRGGNRMTIAVFAESDGGNTQIVTDASSVYWIAKNQIMRVSKQGGAPVTLLTSQFQPKGLFIDESNLYWFAEIYLYKSDKSGKSPMVVSTDPRRRSSVAFDGSRFYWIDEDGEVIAQSKSGEPPTVLASVQLGSNLVSDNTTIYWATGIHHPNNQELMSIPKTEGIPLATVQKPAPVTIVVGAQENLTNIALEDANLYWTRCAEDSILVQPIVVGTTNVLLRDACPKAFAVDAQNIYFSEADALKQMTKSGGIPQVLAVQQNSINKIITDDGAIYWSDCGTPENKFQDGAVMRLERQDRSSRAIAESQLCPSHLQSDENYLYWDDGTQIVRAPKLGGPLQILATSKIGIVTFALSENDIFWIQDESTSRSGASSCTDETSSLNRMSKNGGPGVMLDHLQGRGFAQLSVDATTVYYTYGCGGDVLYKYDKQSQSKTQFCNDNVCVGCTIWLHDRFVYWVVVSEGTIKRMPKQLSNNNCR